VKDFTLIQQRNYVFYVHKAVKHATPPNAVFATMDFI